MNPDVLFAWHEKQQSLVLIDHQARTGTAYPVAFLKAIGWAVNIDTLRLLPRFDAGPRLVAGDDKSIAAAQKIEEGRRSLDRQIRSSTSAFGGRRR